MRPPGEDPELGEAFLPRDLLRGLDFTDSLAALMQNIHITHITMVASFALGSARLAIRKFFLPPLIVFFLFAPFPRNP